MLVNKQDQAQARIDDSPAPAGGEQNSENSDADGAQATERTLMAEESGEEQNEEVPSQRQVGYNQCRRCGGEGHWKYAVCSSAWHCFVYVVPIVDSIDQM